MKRLILILALSALACGQAVGVMGEEPRQKRASVPTASRPSTTLRTWVICGSVNVREGPAAEGEVIRWLVDGQEVEVHEERGRWVRISPSTARAEWITEAGLCRP